MTEILDVLVRIPGVTGAALCNQAGECVLSQLTPPFEPILIKQLVSEIRSVFQIMRFLDDSEPQFFVLHLDDAVVAVRQIGELTLVALATTETNSTMLGVGFNVVNLKIREYGPANFELASGSGSVPRPAASSPPPPAVQMTPRPAPRGEATMIASSGLSLSDSGQAVAPDWVGEAVISALLKATARQLGPAAKVILKQEAKRIAASVVAVTPANFGTLVDAIAQRITDPTKRSAFVTEARALLRR
jgi:hypothetical protein